MATPPIPEAEITRRREAVEACLAETRYDLIVVGAGLFLVALLTALVLLSHRTTDDCPAREDLVVCAETWDLWGEAA